MLSVEHTQTLSPAVCCRNDSYNTNSPSTSVVTTVRNASHVCACPIYLAMATIWGRRLFRSKASDCAARVATIWGRCLFEEIQQFTFTSCKILLPLKDVGKCQQEIPTWEQCLRVCGDYCSPVCPELPDWDCQSSSWITRKDASTSFIVLFIYFLLHSSSSKSCMSLCFFAVIVPAEICNWNATLKVILVESTQSTFPLAALHTLTKFSWEGVKEVICTNKSIHKNSYAGCLFANDSLRLALWWSSMS